MVFLSSEHVSGIGLKCSLSAELVVFENVCYPVCMVLKFWDNEIDIWNLMLNLEPCYFDFCRIDYGFYIDALFFWICSGQYRIRLCFDRSKLVGLL